jgi:Rrf2 family transcriptional regulator, cysteine metabolism repressor
MQVSQKCQYTLRALFELAKREGGQPVAAAEIADAQAIPSRFLELILQELRGRGMVESRRGNKGGYALVASPKTTSVGDVIRAVDGPLTPVKCVASRSDKSCRLKNRCAFMNVWQKAQKAMEEVYNNTTLQNLIDDERTAAERSGLPMYVV